MTKVRTGWTLAIHGGAGSMTPETLAADEAERALAGLRAALDAGGAMLEAGGAALDAVAIAVRVLEDDPAFNAGRGSVFTWDGHIECDAAIMDGRDRRAGAVAGVTATRHPIDAARAVMERSPHVLLSAAGADAFSAEQGLEQAPPDWFATPARRRQLDEIKARPDLPFDSGMKYGTVGAVAMDATGHVAAATSTGGLTAKRWGRIGDSALIGAGTYADDRAGAVSCTGSGEHFIRLAVAHELTARRRLVGETLGQAADALIAELSALGGKGGFIAVSPQGDALWRFNTPGMFRGLARDGGEATVAVFGEPVGTA
ncbi:isoaspartyl peptidase/L-asparaginase family protein [Sphingomonas sp.]|uniref:isoaspartyl peptidase/L-asparaginase family protein n=1 Tax=Sphingomonas sp. TaxID=28214 RepID=UPI003AFFE29F